MTPKANIVYESPYEELSVKSLKQAVEAIKQDLLEVERWKYADETAQNQKKKFCEEMRRRMDGLLSISTIYYIDIEQSFVESLLKQAVKTAVLLAKIIPDSPSLIDVLLGQGQPPTGSKNTPTLNGMLSSQAYEDIKAQLKKDVKVELKKVVE